PDVNGKTKGKLTGSIIEHDYGAEFSAWLYLSKPRLLGRNGSMHGALALFYRFEIAPAPTEGWVTQARRRGEYEWADSVEWFGSTRPITCECGKHQFQFEGWQHVQRRVLQIPDVMEDAA